MTDRDEFPTIRRLEETRTPPERLPEAVEALAAAIERGHHIALVAGEGARLCRLYSAVAIRDFEEDEAHGVVLVATADRARRLARSIDRIGAAAGWMTVSWTSERAAAGAPLPDRAVIVATPARLLEDVRKGDVSLGRMRFLALDDVAALETEWTAVEGVLQAGEGEIRRVAATHRRDDRFDELVTRLLPRARRWPPELFADDERAPATSGPPLRWAVAAGYDARLARLAAVIHGWATRTDADSVTVWCDAAVAESVSHLLAIEGFALAGPGEIGVAVRPLADLTDGPADGPSGPAVLFGLPWSADELRSALGPATARAAVVEPRHVAQLEILAARVGWPSRPLPDTPRAFAEEVEGFRDMIEEAIASRDLAGGALLIEPLLEEHGFERVAAALATLLRDRPAVPPARDAPTPGPRDTDASPRTRPSRDAERATRPTWSRVWINVGRKEGAAPGDFVGAITGETGAVGGQIGKIDIKQKFSLIDIDSMVVDEVVRGLNGKQIKGRDVVVRLDRSPA
ncbi:MAG: DbpA RNA binding domain-containing protein [Gemmatimonadota bacterium]|nr:DbpA RNA binding domain-containing protein [Gemmatimonadota bacterium]